VPILEPPAPTAHRVDEIVPVHRASPSAERRAWPRFRKKRYAFLRKARRSAMSDTGTTIYQPSDLNRRYRRVLQDARAGAARIRDNDGTALVIVPERRFQALRSVAEAAANLAGLQRALDQRRSPTLADFGAWTWLRVLDPDDLRTFLAEVQEAVMLAGREESAGPLEDTLQAWRLTAEQADDPVRDAILLGTHRPEDFVEARHPG
jgi:hypothetical protein